MLLPEADPAGCLVLFGALLERIDDLGTVRKAKLREQSLIGRRLTLDHELELVRAQ